MTGIVDWAARRARMVIAFIILSLLAGSLCYTLLPKEGEPDIEIPALFISVPFPGISAADAESLIVKPMETELADIDGLKKLGGLARENYAGVSLEFEFGWNKNQVLADVRDAMNAAEAKFPEGAEKSSINEINFSEFPIIIVNLTGDVPERTMVRVVKELQDRLEALEPVLEAGIAGNRDEMLEVEIDPLRMEAYNVTANELLTVTRNNNRLIAAGELETAQGAFGVKIPSSFDNAIDVYSLPVKTNGDRVVRFGDIAKINLTFEDRQGTARFNGETTIALQVVKRKGFNVIDTAQLVRQEVARAQEDWPELMRATVSVGTSIDQSRIVASMVSQLEGSVLTAIALVMIVVLASLGTRAALLVGFAIPTSFLLCFALLAIMGVAVSNIVMFGLILAVGMLVDGAIVVVEYADKRIAEGSNPMRAYVEAAKRMFWPIVSSTGTTLCAFLPMLFWPGVPGQFMGMLPVTLIFVLSASLVVALVYLPVMGGVSGQFSRSIETISATLRASLPWLLRAALVLVAIGCVFVSISLIMAPPFEISKGAINSFLNILPGLIAFILSALFLSITMDATRIIRKKRFVERENVNAGFGGFIRIIIGNPIMPLVSIATVMLIVANIFVFYGANNRGVEFFVESEPEQAIVYVQAQGNYSLAEKDAMVREIEHVILGHPGISSAFAFSGQGGLDNNTGGAQPPKDTIGQIQLETIPWGERAGRPELDGNVVLDALSRKLAKLPGIRHEILELAQGPANAKPVHLRLKGNDLETLTQASLSVRRHFEGLRGLELVEDTLPLPGIDWKIDVDVEKAGRYGADVATVGAVIQLVTRGFLLDTMRVPSSDEEIEIRVRFPEEYRTLSALDTLKVRTSDGLVPLANFITKEPVPRLASISRIGQERFFDVKAGVSDGLNVLSLTWNDTVMQEIGLGRKLAEENYDRGNSRHLHMSIKDAELPFLYAETEQFFEVTELNASADLVAIKEKLDQGAKISLEAMTPNERIQKITTWLEEDASLPSGIAWEWTGDQEDQKESGAFLVQAFAGALGLMFIILLAQFNSFYNAALVLIAVVLSTAGVLVGMLVMGQPFSIIMTGTGIVALAGIVVNNNIVLIDTYQEYARFMQPIEAIIRTCRERIRPVLLTTITTMAGLAPMMFGISIDFVSGSYSVDSPTALWWKQLATAVVFGLGIATLLTLVFTPALLAVRIWFLHYVLWLANFLAFLSLGRSSAIARDWALRRAAHKTTKGGAELIWDEAVLSLGHDAPQLLEAPQNR